MSTIPNGYRPNGDGPDGETWGRDPETGRAYTKAGKVRKARTAKDETAMLADLAERERKAQSTIGRKVLSGMGAFSRFMDAFGKYRAWVREARQYATDEAIEAKREALEQAIRDLEAKQEAAQAFLAEQGEAIEQAGEVFASVGASFIDYAKANKGQTPDEDTAADLIGSAIDPETVEAVEAAADPEADPFLAFRRNAPEAEEDGDEDTLD
jgi:hypothetical protein